MACNENRLEAAQMLLRFKANPTSRNQAGLRSLSALPTCNPVQLQAGRTPLEMKGLAQDTKAGILEVGRAWLWHGLPPHGLSKDDGKSSQAHSGCSQTHGQRHEQAANCRISHGNVRNFWIVLLSS